MRFVLEGSWIRRHLSSWEICQNYLEDSLLQGASRFKLLQASDIHQFAVKTLPDRLEEKPKHPNYWFAIKLRTFYRLKRSTSLKVDWKPHESRLNSVKANGKQQIRLNIFGWIDSAEQIPPRHLAGWCNDLLLFNRYDRLNNRLTPRYIQSLYYSVNKCSKVPKQAAANELINKVYWINDNLISQLNKLFDWSISQSLICNQLDGQLMEWS